MSVHRLSHDDLLAYRAEKGWTAISIEICPHDPVTVITPDDELHEQLRLLERMVIAKGDWSGPASYASVRAAMADGLVPAIAASDRRQIANCATVAIWCALNHPRDGGVMQARMASLKRSGLAAHFTICRGPQGTYGTSLGESYADLRAQVAQRIEPGKTIFKVVN
jgi:hypothetical protein